MSSIPKVKTNESLADRRLDSPNYQAQQQDSLLVRLGLVLIGILLVLIFCEFGIRIFWNNLTTAPVWSDRPGKYYAPEVSNKSKDFVYQVPKPTNTFRITAVGDSFTFPPYLQFDDAYPKRLERMLNLNNGEENKLHAEVVNLGRWGASSSAEQKAFKKAIDLQSNLILLEITLNDPERRPFKENALASKGKYAFGPLVISPETNPLFYYWRTIGFIATRIHNTRTHESVVRYHHDLFSNPKTWGTFVSAISSMADSAQKAHVPFAAFIFPFMQYPLDDNYPFHEEHKKISELLSSLNVPHFDLLPAFYGIPSERLIVIPGKDAHPNEIAHRIAAENVYQWLSEAKLVPSELQIHNSFVRRGSHEKKAN